MGKSVFASNYFRLVKYIYHKAEEVGVWEQYGIIILLLSQPYTLP